MQVIRIAEDGTVLNRQPVPDDYVLDGGEMRGPAGHVIPGRWYRAPQGARDGGRYDAGTATYTPPPPPPIEEVRARQIDAAIAEASRRRARVLGDQGGDELLAIRNWLSLTARSLGKVRREARGRGKPGEDTELDALEAQTDQLDAIDRARDTIRAEIRASADPGAYDVVNSPHWPSDSTPQDPEPEPNP